MSKVKDGALIIEQQPAEKCERCGRIDELRPYGIGGKNVCFDCAMKTPEIAKAAFRKRMEGKPIFYKGEQIA